MEYIFSRHLQHRISFTRSNSLCFLFFITPKCYYTKQRWLVEVFSSYTLIVTLPRALQSICCLNILCLELLCEGGGQFHSLEDFFGDQLCSRTEHRNHSLHSRKTQFMSLTYFLSGISAINSIYLIQNEGLVFRF